MAALIGPPPLSTDTPSSIKSCLKALDGQGTPPKYSTLALFPCEICSGEISTSQHRAPLCTALATAMPTSAPAPEKRPRAPSLTKSFSRYEPGRTSAPSRSRATTLSDEMTAPQLLSSYDEPDELPADPLQRPPVDSEQQTAAASSQSLEIDRFPAGFDQLPVELASLTDR